jgi:putative tricarboxylic transport membrane protein
MRAADLVTAAVLALIGAVVVFDALRIGIGWGTDGPKSGFFPFWLGVLMLATCGAISVQAWRTADSKAFVGREQLGPVLKVLWPAVALVLVTQWLGLYVAAALYTGFYMRWIGRHSWAAVVAVAILFPLATFLTFEKWFLVPMPKGPLEAWLGY